LVLDTPEFKATWLRDRDGRRSPAVHLLDKDGITDNLHLFSEKLRERV
jgi:hypothetical protein